MTGDASALFRSRVLFVTGKGGVGKTTTAAAVGRVAAATGRRTLVMEVDNQHPSLPAIFGKPAAHQPVEVEPNLWIANTEWQPALEDWVESIVSMRRLVRLIMKNRVVSLFLQVTPGARDLVMLWRVSELAKSFDLVVVDMPASGNAVAMLSVPLTAERLFPSGPIRACAEALLAMVARPDTALVLVALPEEMVVNETLETLERLQAGMPTLRVPIILLNRASMPTLSERERSLLRALEREFTEGVAVEVLEAGAWEEGLEAATGEALARLQEAKRPVIALPSLPRNDGARRVAAQMASALARGAGLRVLLRGGA